MKEFIGLILAAVLAIVSAAPSVIGAEAAVALRLRDRLPLMAQVSGRQTLTCRSDWHNVKVDSEIGGRFFLLPVDLRRMIPPEAAVGASWRADEAFTRLFGERFFRAIELRHRDPVAYERWRGKGPMNEELVVTGGATMRFVSVERIAGRRTARLQMDGLLEFKDSGRMRSRLGPNNWSAMWKLDLKGEMALDLEKGEITSMTLEGRGKVEGAYETPGGDPKMDPWETAMTLKISVRPLKPELRARLLRLMAELGDEDYGRRQRATEAAKKLAPELKAALVATLLGSDDPELRYRAELIEPKLKKKPVEERPPRRRDIPPAPGEVFFHGPVEWR